MANLATLTLQRLSWELVLTWVSKVLYERMQHLGVNETRRRTLSLKKII